MIAISAGERACAATVTSCHEGLIAGGGAGQGDCFEEYSSYDGQ